MALLPPAEVGIRPGERDGKRLSGTDGATMEVSTILATANGTYSISLDLNSTATARPYCGLPSTRLIGGDLHAILASDDHNRGVLAFRRDVAPWTVAFGPSIVPPLVDVYATTPVARLRARISVGPVTTSYGGLLEASFVQAGMQRAILMHFSQSILAAAPNYELRTPIFSGLQGWNESLYGLQLGSPVAWMLEALSNGSFVPADGAVLRSVTFNGQLTP